MAGRVGLYKEKNKQQQEVSRSKKRLLGGWATAGCKGVRVILVESG